MESPNLKDDNRFFWSLIQLGFRVVSLPFMKSFSASCSKLRACCVLLKLSKPWNDSWIYERLLNNVTWFSRQRDTENSNGRRRNPKNRGQTAENNETWAGQRRIGFGNESSFQVPFKAVLKLADFFFWLLKNEWGPITSKRSPLSPAYLFWPYHAKLS